MNLNTKLFVSAMAVAAAVAVNAHAADELHSGDLNTMDRWYGRAGGLTDADRVTSLTVGRSKVTVPWDADVAARTNLPRREVSNSNVGVSYDADVSARTNMPRGGDAGGRAEAAAVEGNKNN